MKKSIVILALIVSASSVVSAFEKEKGGRTARREAT